MMSTGPSPPKGWQPYELGPTSVPLELNVVTNNTLSLCRNIIGVIQGAVEPDRFIIMGVHRDAWINGAVDPISGMSTVLEISRSIGEQLKTGWRPRRTIMFASWDAEEPGIMGSFEFVEDFMVQLKHKAVVYINLDAPVSNPDLLNMISTPNLHQLLYRAAKETRSPNKKYDTMFDFWVGAEEVHNNKIYTDPPVKLIGSGSDYTAFLNEVGVSCVNFAYRPNYGTYPVYHTQYDTYEWVNKFGDPEFIYHKRIGEFAASVLLSLAEEALLPLSAAGYATKVKALTESLVTEKAIEFLKKEANPIGLLAFSRQFEENGMELDKFISNTTIDSLGEDNLRILNDKLMMMDRQFIHAPGLPGRPSLRHVLFAPSSTNTYAGSAFPGISDELASGGKGDTQKQISIASSKLEAANRALEIDQELV